MLSCYKCQAKLQLVAGSNISRREECEKCSCDLHCCMMCEFYDQNSYNECREPNAERITEKEKANFCDYFKLGSPQSSTQKASDALSTAELLFKK